MQRGKPLPGVNVEGKVDIHSAYMRQFRIGARILTRDSGPQDCLLYLEITCPGSPIIYFR